MPPVFAGLLLVKHHTHKHNLITYRWGDTVYAQGLVFKQITTLISELFDQLSRFEQVFKAQIQNKSWDIRIVLAKNNGYCQPVNCRALMSPVNSFVFEILMPDYLYPGSRRGDESCNFYMPLVPCLSLSLAAPISVVLVFCPFYPLPHTHSPVG